MKPHSPRWCYFYDFHTAPDIPAIGVNLDIDAWLDRVQAAGVDLVVFPARCNMGFAYYDTKIGIRHPHLQFDLLRGILDGCHRRGIAFSAYINAGLSHEEALRRRDWTTVSPDGHVYGPDRLDNFFRRMCYNSGYGEHLLAMTREITANYPVDGMFFDCMQPNICIGGECVAEMKELGYRYDEPQSRYEFARMSRNRLMRRIAEQLRADRPGLLLYFNGPDYEEQREYATYFECECLPTGGWGYDVLPVLAHYVRNVAPELPVVNMTGRFHASWGDFGGIRTEASLAYDCIYGLAHTMRTNIGDHLHPRGDRNDAVLDLEAKVYGKFQQLEPWLDGAVSCAEVVLVMHHEAWRCAANPNPLAQQALQSIQGAARMLEELKIPFQIVNDLRDLPPCRVLILADEIRLSEQLAQQVRRHLAAGGKVISSYHGGLAETGDDFALPELWGMHSRGEWPYDPAFLTAPELPPMPFIIGAEGTLVTPLSENGAEVRAALVKPFFNRGWNGEHGLVYLPPDAPTGEAAALRYGNVLHCVFPLFRNYFRNAQIPMRQLFGAWLTELYESPFLAVEGLPGFGRIAATRQEAEHRTMVYLMSYVPELRGAYIQMIEEPVIVRQVRIRLRTNSKRIHRVYAAPEQIPLEFHDDGAHVEVVVPEIPGHAVIVFEEYP